ncbi:MAG TPA: glutathione S-transferase N-terminal domain-containing protein [Nevskiaceae bacterium]|nr:glutathione S-transferase N-terminal domain-containing protein [Nevskiaceae bacterium]
MRARSKYTPSALPAANAGLTLHCSAHGLGCHWVRLVLAEKDVEGARVELLAPGRHHEDLLLLNPSHVLPTLVERDLVLYPAAVIIDYLDERYPHPRLLPSDPPSRARLRMVLTQLQSELLPLLTPPSASAAAQKQRRQLADQLAAIHRLLPARGWFLGLDYNQVDTLWAVLLWALRGSDNEFLARPVRDSLERYGERLFARPAFARSQPPTVSPARGRG